MEEVRETEADRLARLVEKTLRYRGYNDGIAGLPPRHPSKLTYMEGYNRACSLRSPR